MPPHVSSKETPERSSQYWRGFLGGSLLTALTAYVLFVTIATGSKSTINGSIHIPSVEDHYPTDNASNIDNRSLNMLQVALHRLQSLRRSPGERHIPPSEHINSPPADLAFLTQPSSRRSPRDNYNPPSLSSSPWQNQQGRMVTRNKNMNMSTRSGGAATHPSHANSSQWLSCRARYGTRSFLSPDQRRKPPMLYTFPGSGNTWCRLLIEYATGTYTGSVYNDKSLLEALPGEFTCNHQVSVIKIHPHTHTFAQLRSTRFNSDAEKCSRGNIKSIDRAILLIRNPFDSIWSEYQRRVTQDHVGGVLRETFDWPRWQANAANLAHQYNLMWTVHHAGIDKQFSAKDVLYVRYEDLKDKSTRIDAMRSISSFLGLNHPSNDQLECAYLLAESRHAHRVTDAQAQLMTKSEAYTRPLACRMWNLFGASAARYNYSVWGGYDCSNITEAVPRINVGPQGEYNHQWVKPGMQLLDFGDHFISNPQQLSPSSSYQGGGKMKKKIAPSKRKPKPKNNSMMKFSKQQHKQPSAPLVDIAHQTAVATDESSPRHNRDGAGVVEMNAAARGKPPLDELVSLSGMSLEQAMSPGAVIATVGRDKPAWAER